MMARRSKLRSLLFTIIMYCVFWLNLLLVLRYGSRTNSSSRPTLGNITSVKRYASVTFSENTSSWNGATVTTSTHTAGTTQPSIGKTFHTVGSVVENNAINNQTQVVEPVAGKASNNVIVETDPNPVANPHPFKFTIANEDACANRSNKNGNLFLVILVKCRPEERFDREQIRQTWGGVTEVLGERVLTMFLVGQSTDLAVRSMIKKEDEKTHDFIQEDFNEGYYNLTYKTLMGWKWVMTHCPKVSYTVSVDADMMLNVRNLVQRLKTRPRANFAEGNLRTGYYPHRDKSSKWFVTQQEYPHTKYPPWLNGGCYVFSADVAIRVFKTSAHVPFLKLDDVYMGIVLAKAKIKPSLCRLYQQYIVNKQLALKNGIGIGIPHNTNQVNANFKAMWKETVGSLL